MIVPLSFRSAVGAVRRWAWLDASSVSVDLPGRSPAIIGATGGSGSRVLARVVRQGGMYIGENLYGSEDPPELGVFSDRWINVFMTRELSGFPSEVEAAMARELAAVVTRHLAARRPGVQAWGWKEPRSIFLLPFLHRQFPSMRFVHVIRDGRDMALSDNQNQLNKHGHTLLSPAEAHLPQAIRAMLLWSRLNIQAAEYGKQALGARYLCVRFEDLCRDPEPMVARLFAFLGLKGDAVVLASREVAPPPTLGRWRARDQETIAQIEKVGRTALERFGYLDGASARPRGR